MSGLECFGIAAVVAFIGWLFEDKNKTSGNIKNNPLDASDRQWREAERQRQMREQAEQNRIAREQQRQNPDHFGRW